MKTGLVDDVTGRLSDEGLDYVIFNDVTPNPRDHEVMEGAEVFDAEECNMIVALGEEVPLTVQRPWALLYPIEWMCWSLRVLTGFQYHRFL
ncbi:MAG: iron-containing alcohol dehydrogenase [Methanothermobacter sp.]|nr:iron-containing alcohol dehydrogenase [Methanothermobacter sp.]MDI9619092.1 iron-containing alcohol dehydrogenase [Methanothermobacter sp.]